MRETSLSDLRPVPLSEPCLGGNDRRYLDECLASTFVSSVGPFVERFEREFALRVGARHAVACSSGTAAIHVALRLLGVGPGDEVFVSDLTFVASANPVLYERAVPVLVDAEAGTWNLDPELAAGEIRRRAKAGLRQPKAVEAVHILGQPARLEPLAEACERHGIALIEDAAEALGARWTSGRFAGRQVGTAGRIGCYSFNGNKIITTGGGGMIVTDDPELARRAKHLTTQAKLPGAEYRHDELGYNYRLSNLAAALGVAQLEKLDEHLRRKKEIAARYDAAFRDRAGLILPPRPADVDPSFWLYTIRVDPAAFGIDARALLQRLRAAGVESRPVWTPLHLMPMYRDVPRLGGEVAERLFAEALSLPCSPGLRPEDQERVVRGVLA